MDIGRDSADYKHQCLCGGKLPHNTQGQIQQLSLIHILQKDPMLRYKYTSIGNMIAVVSDGSAVLGLGNIGALAGLPVMEGKCVLFKEFGGVNAFPLCLNTQDADTIVETVKLLEPSFSGINLEDISAPRCFEIEERLKTVSYTHLIEKSFNGKNMTGSEDRLFIADFDFSDLDADDSKKEEIIKISEKYSRIKEISSSSRVGIKQGTELMLRFYIKGSRFVSGKHN